MYALCSRCVFFCCMLLGASAIGDFTCFVSGDNVITLVDSVRKENWCCSLFLSSTVRDERRERPLSAKAPTLYGQHFLAVNRPSVNLFPKVKIPPSPVGGCPMDSGPEGKKTFL
ncbi:MAG: hypothetical protein BYD32DRAFT_430828 [Podila humilis]|nr:MAG: hypothetical protein BYD32DRAFT_430828 [Podila humilis]